MGRLVLVTGGARSGKSLFAEDLAKKFGEDVLYIATSISFDEEMKLRVKKHREQRPSGWETFEAYKDLDRKLEGRTDGKSAVMLDCITIMVSNIMFEEPVNWEDLKSDEIEDIERNVKDEIEKLLKVVRAAKAPFIVVTNETGMGIVPENVLSRVFRDIAGRVNQQLAKEAEEVYFCVSGISIRIK